MAAYMWNYRLAPQEGADAQAMIAAMDRQIGLLFDGVGARLGHLPRLGPA